jgi:FxLD family lantipeptide
MQMIALPATATGMGDDLDFDLDVSIVESGPIAELMRSTDDGCGYTCRSMCPISC